MTVENDAPEYLKLLRYGEELMAENRHVEAMNAFVRAVNLRPQFWYAFYQMGNVLLDQKKYLESANAFFLACLHSHYRKEAVLMCGRSLAMAEFYMESAMMFDRVALEKLDAVSALCYSEVLLKEGRIRDGLAVIEMFSGQLPKEAVDRLKGAMLIDLGDIPNAEIYLRAAVKVDANGFAYDYMISVLFSNSDLRSLMQLLDDASIKFTVEYYPALKAALEYLIGERAECVSGFREIKSYALCETVQYIRPYFRQGVPLTGNTYQTFDIVNAFVPVSGLISEFGVRNGHTITKLAEMFPSRKVFGFDSFVGLPEAWNDEGAGSYSALGKLPAVPNNVEFVVGWFEDTLPEFKKTHSEPIAFMNVDCDLYSATKTIFDELDRQIVPGTIIIFDEYIVNPSWREDEFKAFQEWVNVKNVKYEYLAFSLYTKQAAVKILSRDVAALAEVAAT